ncbi:MAG: DUF3631 domain-containing protein [Acidimicrobiales bacterium]
MWTRLVGEACAVATAIEERHAMMEPNASVCLLDDRYFVMRAADDSNRGLGIENVALVEKLKALENSTSSKQQLDLARLAKDLRAFNIQPHKVELTNRTQSKGYSLDDLTAT